MRKDLFFLLSLALIIGLGLIASYFFDVYTTYTITMIIAAVFAICYVIYKVIVILKKDS